MTNRYRTFRCGPLTAGYEPGLGWVRVFDYGVSFKDRRVHRAYFSERNGYGPGFYLGPYYITPLAPMVMRAVRVAPPRPAAPAPDGRVWN